MGTKAFIGTGVCFAIVGLALIILGTFVLPKEDPKLMTNKLNQYLTVDSSSAPLYERWAGQFDDLLNYQMKFYFYNLTNAIEVTSQGAVPVYTQQGPYIWRRHRQAVDVTFPDNGNQVQYSEHTTYTFEQDISNGTESDLFTNINPSYVGAVAIAGSENNLFAAAVGAYINNLTEWYTGPFVDLVGGSALPSFWGPRFSASVQVINQTVQNTEQAVATFFSIWANATSAGNMTGNWTSMLVSPYQNSTQPSNISLASALMLFNQTQGSGSLLDEAAVDTWGAAIYNSTLASEVASLFMLTADQLQTVMRWKRYVFVPNEIYPTWINQFGLDQASDVGYLQFGNAQILNGTAAATAYPMSFAQNGWVTPNAITGVVGVEWSIVSGSFPFANWLQFAVALNPEIGLGNKTLWQATLLNQNPLNLTADQVSSVLTYGLLFGNSQVPVDLVAHNGPTGGLIATKTIKQWIYDCHDFVIGLVRDPEVVTCNMLFNDTTFAPNLIWTGKDDISKIDQYINFQGAPSIDNVFAGSLELGQGIYTELGQFAPNLPVGGILHPFDPHFMRPMQLNYTQNTSVLGVDAFKYVMDAKWVFAQNPFLYQEGIGFANVTGAQNESPIFLSLWDQLYVGQCFPPNNASTNGTVCPVYNASAKVIGQFPTNDDDDSAVLNIEPQTGITLEASKKLQANLYVASKNDYNYFPLNQNIQDDTYYPLSKAGEYVIVTQDLADEIKNKLAIVGKVNNAMFYVGVTVGPVFVVLGIILVAIGLRRKRRGHYSAINE